tara:strand:- start:595 stop:807 length:213 start_codon:yes stop_codon:yes gene_type:complete
MDLDLQNIMEIKQIRELISHKKNLLRFFDELIDVKNIQVNEKVMNADYDLDNDTLYSSDSDSSADPTQST